MKNKMKTKPSSRKLEAPLLDPAKRSLQKLSYTVPIEVNYLTEESASRLGLDPAWFIQCAICDATSRVMVMDDPEERNLNGVVGSWIAKALEAKNTGKRTPVASGKMVEVTVRLPKAFAARMEDKCEADSITLAETIAYLVEQALPQQFDDNGIELEMVRHITEARTGDSLQ